MNENVERILAMQARLTKELNTLRQECPHTNKTGVFKGNTGNWSSSDDSYWIDAKCLDCGKSWLIDSVTDNYAYRKFDGEVIQ